MAFDEDDASQAFSVGDRSYISEKSLVLVREAQHERAVAKRDGDRRRRKDLSGGDVRCPVCTLLYGTCEHDAVWLAHRAARATVAADERLRKYTVDVAAAVAKREWTYTSEFDDEPDAANRDGMREINDTAASLPYTAAIRDLLEDRLPTAPETPAVDPRAPAVPTPAMHWRATETTEASAGSSRPSPRGGHSMVALGDRLVVFGGVTFEAAQRNERGAFLPYETALSQAVRAKDVYVPEQRRVYFGPEVHLIAFDGGAMRWDRLDGVSGGSKVTPRYGHAALAFDDERMFVFGGRAENGQFLDDTYFFRLPRPVSAVAQAHAADLEVQRAALDLADDGSVDTEALRALEKKHRPRPRQPRWLKGGATGPRPPARCYAAAAKTGRDAVALFGGCDAVQCLESLWLYDARLDVWSEPIFVGVPPTPRFGHAMVPLPGGSDGGRRILVLGGSEISVVAAHGAGDGPAAVRALAQSERDLGAAAEALAQRAANEASYARRAANVLRDQARCASATTPAAAASEARGLSRLAAAAAANAALAEARSADAEAAVLRLAKRHKATDYWNRSQLVARADVCASAMMLDLDALAWRSAPFARAADAPADRAHFGACVLRNNKAGAAAKHAVRSGVLRPSFRPFATIDGGGCFGPSQARLFT
ncbi:hypothetical protein M885DRAFT_31058 [Pelagophyceae sp. CCMP2097]|nr:hypothetical protein M885DRAFT_31058 [Pelagophyceae sp. CCMP2097]